MRQPTKNSNPPSPAGTALIILAAGTSTRLGKPKQLLPFRGRSLLRHAAETALASVCRPAVVVLGAGEQQLRTELSGLPVTVTLNPAWAEGMASSIRAGLGTVTSEANDPDCVVIMLCDQPLITAETLDELVKVHRKENQGIVACEYEDTLGVPALFSREYFSELAGLAGDEGARKIILKHNKNLSRIPAPEAAFDVDRLEQAARLEALGQAGWSNQTVEGEGMDLPRRSTFKDI